MSKFNFSSFINTAASNTSTFITPFNANLAEGEYQSTVIRIDDSQLELDSGFMDFFMELTDASNTTVTVRFRVYQNTYLADWINTFAGYGCTGNLSSIVGIKEKIVVSHGATYAYISEREQVLEKLSNSSSGGRGGRTLLGKKRSGSSHIIAEERRKSLLDDSDDDEENIVDDEEFEDFLDDEED